jgi:hypothetical protein
LDKFIVREGISMSVNSESENRFLDVSEKEMVVSPGPLRSSSNL